MSEKLIRNEDGTLKGLVPMGWAVGKAHTKWTLKSILNLLVNVAIVGGVICVMSLDRSQQVASFESYDSEACKICLNCQDGPCEFQMVNAAMQPVTEASEGTNWLNVTSFRPATEQEREFIGRSIGFYNFHGGNIPEDVERPVLTQTNMMPKLNFGKWFN